jgi:N6-L-threonylcarbamoyladenine synthase
MVGRAEPHFSFAGLKTAVRRTAETLAPLKDRDVADIAAAFENAVAASVSDRCARAMDLTIERLGQDAPRHLVVAGGVAANERLRTILRDRASSRGFAFHVPPISLCGDNAAMIAWTGAERLALGLSDPLNAPVRPRWPLDTEAPPAIGAGVKA